MAPNIQHNESKFEHILKRGGGELTQHKKKEGVWEKIFQDVLHGIHEGVHIVDHRGITIFYNLAASKLDGMEREEVLGIHVLDAFPSLTKKTSTLLSVLETGKQLPSDNQTYMNRKGKQITTINRTLPVLQEGEIIGAIELSQDITQVRELSEQVNALREQMWQSPKDKKVRANLYCFDDFFTSDSRLQHELEKAKKVAFSQAPVMIIGETGTGKEIISQSIHQLGKGDQNPFIVQNCAAIPSSLLESLLFGTEKGAFTGAEDRAGLFELADGGTLFLDEIHTMPIDLQAKLLRVLEDGFVRRVGGTRLRTVNVRIITATNQDPWNAVEEGLLRKDLFYRLHVVCIHLLPLRERMRDLHILTNYFLGNLSRQYSTQPVSISEEVKGMFEQYEWPGNVRELKNVLEGAVHFLEGSVIEKKHLPAHMNDYKGSYHLQISIKGSLQEQLVEVERKMISQALKEADGKVARAAKALQIPRQTLQYKLKRLGIHHDQGVTLKK